MFVSLSVRGEVPRKTVYSRSSIDSHDLFVADLDCIFFFLVACNADP